MRAARMVELTDFLDRRPAALSGGQRQRVALARAIVRQPTVFLMDEPLSNLDAKLRVSTRAQIKNLHHELKTTTIYVTHDQVEAMTLADRVVVMNKGIVQQVGTPIEIYDRPANTFVAGFIGSPAMNLIDGVLKAGVFTADGVRIAGLPTTTEGPVTLGFRAEDALPHRRWRREIAAPAYAIELLGEASMVTVQAGGALIAVKTGKEYRGKIGAPIRATVAAQVCHLFDRASGKAMARQRMTGKRHMALKGFDPRWKDFPDYILGITKEIWEDRGVATLHENYADDVILRGPAGIIQTRQGIINNTLGTLSQFPDRQILGEDVIWSGSPEGRRPAVVAPGAGGDDARPARHLWATDRPQARGPHHRRLRGARQPDLRRVAGARCRRLRPPARARTQGLCRRPDRPRRRAGEVREAVHAGERRRRRIPRAAATSTRPASATPKLVTRIMAADLAAIPAVLRPRLPSASAGRRHRSRLAGGRPVLAVACAPRSPMRVWKSTTRSAATIRACRHARHCAGRSPASTKAGACSVRQPVPRSM